MWGNCVYHRFTSSASLKFYSWSGHISVCHFINSAVHSDWPETKNGSRRWMLEREKKQVLNIENWPWCGKHAPFKSRSPKPWSFRLTSLCQRRSAMVFQEKVYMRSEGQGCKAKRVITSQYRHFWDRLGWVEKGRRLTGKESDANFNKIWTHLNTNGRLPVTYNWTDQPKTFGASRKFRLNSLSENNRLRWGYFSNGHWKVQ